MADSDITIATMTWNVGDGKEVGSWTFNPINDGIHDFIQTNRQKDIIVICLQEVNPDKKTSDKYVKGLSEEFTSFNIIKNMASDDNATIRNMAKAIKRDKFDIFTIILYNKTKGFNINRIDEGNIQLSLYGPIKVPKKDSGGISSLMFDENLYQEIYDHEGGANKLVLSFEIFKLARFIPLLITKAGQSPRILMIVNLHMPFKDPKTNDENVTSEKLTTVLDKFQEYFLDIIDKLSTYSKIEKQLIDSIILGDFNSRSTYIEHNPDTEGHLKLLIEKLKTGKTLDGLLSDIPSTESLTPMLTLYTEMIKISSSGLQKIDNSLDNNRKEITAKDIIVDLIKTRLLMLESTLTNVYTDNTKSNYEIIKNILRYDLLSNLLHESKIFQEAPITFLPSYKFIPNMDEYSLKKGDKLRLCGYADRILYVGDNIQSIANKYKLIQYLGSDHRPVSNEFKLKLTTSRAKRTALSMLQPPSSLSPTPSRPPSRSPSRPPSRSPSRTPVQSPSRPPVQSPSPTPPPTPSPTPPPTPSPTPSRPPSAPPAKSPPLTTQVNQPRKIRVQRHEDFLDSKKANYIRQRMMDARGNSGGKSRKHKSRKHKSRKHKSRKHKYKTKKTRRRQNKYNKKHHSRKR